MRQSFIIRRVHYSKRHALELIRGIQNIREQHRHCVLTIGKFDGVHKGHQALLSGVVKTAQALNLPSCVMIFEPQPVECLAPDLAPARLSRWRDKYELIRELGIDRLLCVAFDRRFSEQPAEDFVSDFLVGKLGVRHLVVGDDFRFGKNRQGDFQLLQRLSQSGGYTVQPTESFLIGHERVSSSAIREALMVANFAKAADMLGRPFEFNGPVVHGQKLGRQLGFPTANLLLKRVRSPLLGVFAVRVKIVAGPNDDVNSRWINGIANIGRRPTLHGVKPQLEVHLFDFSANLYGKRLRVVPVRKIRGERQFDNLDALKTQVLQDIETAKSMITQGYATV